MKRPISMTAFGRGDSQQEYKRWTVEIRSVNHRFCDVKIKIPRQFIALEEKVKKEITSMFSRGHIDVMVTLTMDKSGSVDLSANIPLAKQYHSCLVNINKALGMDCQPTLEIMAGFKDVITEDEKEEDIDAAWEGIQPALAAAMSSCLKMRQDEGEALKNDLLERIAGFSATIENIDQMVPELVLKKKAALQERLNKLLDGVELDPLRLAQEVAVIADKSDITEEIVRLKSHITQCKTIMDLDEPIGRRLDFLLQEFLREINTIASKINDSAVTHLTVDLKNEAEKMREQVQNIE